MYFNYSDMDRIVDINRTISGLKTRLQRPPFMEELPEDIFYFNSGLRFVPRKMVQESLENRDMIDCGSFDGDSVLSFSINYSPRRIFCFEPENKNYRKLLETIDTCKLHNAIPVRKGVGDSQGRHRIRSLGVGSYINEQDGEEIETTTIDSFVKEAKVAPGLIKMDIEGYESKAVAGAMETIRKYRPILLIAIYHTPEDFFGIKTKIETEIGGYKFLIRHLVHYHPVCETFLIAYPENAY